YQLSLKMKKTAGTLGFKIFFGHQDEHNRLIWEIGGWQNQDSLIGADVDGMNSCLTQSIFSLEQDLEYQFDLEVSDRVIRTFINGQLINQTEDILPIIEPLYYTASAEDTTGDVIVKVVNVQDQPVQAKLELVGLSNKQGDVTVYQLSDQALDDKNSFDFPDKVKPKQKE